MKKKLLKRLIKPIIVVIRKVYYFFIDIYESMFGLRDELTPPRSMIFIGNGDFRQIGDEFLRYFIDKGGLKTTDLILDVGCGIGRMAVPLTKYLSQEGSYEGIDIVAEGIDWCTKKITSKYSNFRFQLADVYSERYHPIGKFKSSEYIFPYEDKSFDFIFLTSVFTHMLPHDIENYLSEISRVLKKDSKCLITFFLLNQDSLSYINKKLSIFNFKYNYGDCRIEHDDLPEDAVSYEEGFIRNLYEKYSLNIKDTIYYGSWCGRKTFLSFQDIIIATKH